MRVVKADCVQVYEDDEINDAPCKQGALLISLHTYRSGEHEGIGQCLHSFAQCCSIKVNLILFLVKLVVWCQPHCAFDIDFCCRFVTGFEVCNTSII